MGNTPRNRPTNTTTYARARLSMGSHWCLNCIAKSVDAQILSKYRTWAGKVANIPKHWGVSESVKTGHCCTVRNKMMIDPGAERVNYLPDFSSETEKGGRNGPAIYFIRFRMSPNPARTPSSRSLPHFPDSTSANREP